MNADRWLSVFAWSGVAFFYFVIYVFVKAALG